MHNISVQNLSFHVPENDHLLLDSISISIDASAVSVLIGKNGVGKSTLALLLAGALKPDSGQILIDGSPLTENMERPGYLSQHPANQIIGNTVERDIAYGLENRGLPRDDIENKVDEMLALFDLTNRRSASSSALSGGEKQRTALAALLAMDYQYFVLDEPTSYLDYPAQQSLLQLIHKLNKTGIGFLWITQYPEEREFGDATFLLRTGGITTLSPESDEELPELAGSTDEPPHKRKNCETGGEPVVSMSAGSYKYPGSTFRLNLPEYRLRHGERQGWYGYSGSGKTTLAKLLGGILPPGNINRSFSVDEKEIAYVPQFATQMLYSGTLNATIQLLEHRSGFNKEIFLDRLRGQLRLFRLDADAPFARPAWTFSGGEQRRIILALVTALRPTVLILDEPTIGLSPFERYMLEEVFESDGISAIICISHEYELLREFTNTGVYFYRGKVSYPMDWNALETEYEYQSQSPFTPRSEPRQLSDQSV